MIKSLKCDLHKTFISAGFLAAILVTFLLCFTEDVYVDTSDMRKFSALEALFKFNRAFMESKSSFCSLSVFKSALSGYSAMFLPILASFPFVFSQSAERNSGNIRFSIFRAKRLKYYFSKFFCGVISGRICVLLGIALFGIFSFFFGQNYKRNIASSRIFSRSQDLNVIRIYRLNFTLPTVYSPR